MPIVPDTEIWNRIQEEARSDAKSEPVLSNFLFFNILNHQTIESSLGFILASKLACATLCAEELCNIFSEIFADDPNIFLAICTDFQAVMTRDPACHGYSIPLLYFKGFQSIQAYRLAHHCWETGRRALARHLQNRISEIFAVDLHPGAYIGKGIFFDHATGIVIGETSVLEDNCSVLQGVTLGGTGKENGDRHPKIQQGVMIGAGAKILGNITIGEGVKIGAGSVVLHNVPSHCTVVGIPARRTGTPIHALPALEMDQSIDDEENR